MNTKILLLVMYLLAWGCYSQARGSILRIGYESREGMLAKASCDTSRMIPNVMLEDLIETLRKMPGLIVNRKGEISADDNRKIVYKLNGLRDPLVNNPIELLSALNSKYVKKVELVTHILHKIFKYEKYIYYFNSSFYYAVLHGIFASA